MNLLVCARCGERATDVAVDAEAALKCDECGYSWTFRSLPLYCVTGPSGAGKSTVARLLVSWLSDRFVVLEQDVLWQAGLRDDSATHRVFRSAWLRMSAMIHQSGRPVVLCGTVVPPEIEPLPERRLFSSVHYLALTSDRHELRARLAKRPAWREWDDARIAETLEYAEWIRDHAQTLNPPMTLLDTTNSDAEHTAEAVREWVLRHG